MRVHHANDPTFMRPAEEEVTSMMHLRWRGGYQSYLDLGPNTSVKHIEVKWPGDVPSKVKGVKNKRGDTAAQVRLSSHETVPHRYS